MQNIRKAYTADFKAKVVKEILKEEKTLSQIASEYETHTNVISRWRDQAVAALPGIFSEQQASYPNHVWGMRHYLHSSEAWMDVPGSHFRLVLSLYCQLGTGSDTASPLCSGGDAASALASTASHL